MEGPASKRGVEYEVANGEKIPNLGEKKFRGVTIEGKSRNITAQVCDVNKALLSVKKVMSAGNRVVFDGDGSYIEDKASGAWESINRVGNSYDFVTWIQVEEENTIRLVNQDNKSGFPRPGENI